MEKPGRCWPRSAAALDRETAASDDRYGRRVHCRAFFLPGVSARHAARTRLRRGRWQRQWILGNERPRAVLPRRVPELYRVDSKSALGKAVRDQGHRVLALLARAPRVEQREMRHVIALVGVRELEHEASEVVCGADRGVFVHEKKHAAKELREPCRSIDTELVRRQLSCELGCSLAHLRLGEL
eukprot:Amastigsp_a1947_18.p5 type:complete len:184 gc:universal Amastigsp_a1947_18:799-248(-)